MIEPGKGIWTRPKQGRVGQNSCDVYVLYCIEVDRQRNEVHGNWMSISHNSVEADGGMGGPEREMNPYREMNELTFLS